MTPQKGTPARAAFDRGARDFSAGNTSNPYDSTPISQGGVFKAAWWATGFARAKAKKEGRSCHWSEDDDGVWHTACGEAFQFEAGGPRENKAAFCQYCGKRISAQNFPEPPTVQGEVI